MKRGMHRKEPDTQLRAVLIQRGTWRSSGCETGADVERRAPKLDASKAALLPIAKDLTRLSVFINEPCAAEAVALLPPEGTLCLLIEPDYHAGDEHKGQVKRRYGCKSKKGQKREDIHKVRVPSHGLPHCRRPVRHEMQKLPVGRSGAWIVEVASCTAPAKEPRNGK
jgi:hypothetical protein